MSSKLDNKHIKVDKNQRMKKKITPFRRFLHVFHKGTLLNSASFCKSASQLYLQRICETKGLVYIVLNEPIRQGLKCRSR